MQLGFTSKINRFFTSTILLSIGVIVANVSHAQVRLTDIVTFGADATGSIMFQPDVWDTRPDGYLKNWIQGVPGGAFLNGPSNAQARPNITLSPGTNSFRIYASPGIDNPNFGINLFFDGAENPSISAFGPMLTNVAQIHSFRPDSALPTPEPVPTMNSGIPGAGTLSFVKDNQLVTLTDFYLARPSVFNMDQAGQTSLGPDGVLDYVGGFTLVVTTNTANATPSPDGLAAWWRGEDNAQDAVGSNNGELHGGVTYVAGEVGQGFGFNNGFVSVPASSSLNVGSRSGFTFETWIHPKKLTPQTIAEWHDDAGHAGVSVGISQGPNGAGAPGCLYASLPDSNGHPHFISTGAGIISTNQFQHVALTYDKSSGIAVLYLNGTPVASALLGSFTPQTSYNFYFGATPPGSTASNSFNGVIDELSLYSRALSSSDVAAIYNAGSAGKPVPISPPSSLQPLINVDFGSGGTRGYSLKTGFAAIGQTTNDFWNFYNRDASAISGNWHVSGSLANLKLADGTVSSIGMTVSDAPGAWDDTSSDPMYKTYDYPLDGDNDVVTFTNLPAGHYDVLAYSPDGNYEVSVGAKSYGVKTTHDNPVSRVPTWTEGVQYARFTNITVTADQSLVLTVRNGSAGYAILSGVQILRENGTNNQSACAPAPSGLVAWWKGESNILDSAGTNNGAVTEGTVSYVPGKVGSGFYFNGGPTRILVPNAPALNFGSNQDFSIAAWIKPEKSVTTYNVMSIVDKRYSKDGIDSPQGYEFSLGDGRIHCRFMRTGFGPYGPDLRDGKFHYVALSVKRDSKTGGHLYVDGRVVGTFDPTPYVGSLSNSQPLRIGNHADSSFSTFFKGVIDEVSIYDRALSSNEIAAIYNAGSAGKCLNHEWVVPSGYANKEGGGESGILNQPAREQTVYAATNFPPGPIWITGVRFRPNVISGAAGRAFSNTISNIRFSLSTVTNTPYHLSSAFAANIGADATTVFSGALTLSSQDSGPTQGPKAFDIAVNFTTPFLYNPSSGNLLMDIQNISGEPTTLIDAQNNPVGSASRVNSINPYGTSGVADSGADIMEIIYTAGSSSNLMPTIVAQPTNKTVSAGKAATFTVQATGNTPLNYQWSLNATNLLGATNATLTLNAVQPAQAGNYSVRVFNPYGSVQSSAATLTVTPPVSIPSPAALVAWWKGEDNANDMVGGNNGTLLGGATFTSGKVGQAFSFDGISPSCVRIPYRPELISTNYTVEAWIKPSAQVTGGIGQTLIFGQSYGHVQLVARTGTTGVRVAFQFGINHFTFYDVESHVQIPIGQFTHVAGTWDGTKLRLYINGMLDAESTPGAAPVDAGGDFFIGGFDSPAPGSNQYVGQFFNGAIDELSYYNRALSSNQIAAIYNAGSAGKLLPTPTNPPATTAQQLINVDFGSDNVHGYSQKTGFASVGQTTNDFWNFYNRFASLSSSNWRVSGSLTNLRAANGSVTAVGMTVSDAPGAWNDGSSDPMYATYDYPLNGGNNVVTFTHLPAGQYDVLAYSPDGNYEITVGGKSYGVKTTHDAPVNKVPTWTEGVQYARFTNVTITAGQSLVLTVRNGTSGYAILSGVQILKAGKSANQPTCTQAPAGLTAWWPAENNADDIVGGNNGKIIGNVTYAAGKKGQAFNFDGKSYVEVPDAPALHFTNAMSVEAWVKLRTYQGTNSREIVSKIGGPRPDLGSYTFSIDPRRREAYFLIANDGAYGVTYSSNTIPTNRWVYLVGVYDGQTIQIYVNGKLEGSTKWDRGIFTGNYNPLVIGCTLQYPAPTSFFNGLIDEVSLYKRALSTNEIQAIYDARGAGKCPLPPKVLSLTPTNYYANQGTNVSYQVFAAGSPTLTYQWQHDGFNLPGATNSMLTLSDVKYPQVGNYDVVVSNLVGSTISSNVELRVNRPPLADPSATQPVFISQDDYNALVVLNGSKSSDPDGNALTYKWFATGDAIPFATNMIAVRTLPLGTYQFTLMVNDGMASSSRTFTVAVLTPAQAIDRLIALVQSSSPRNRPLIIFLRAALFASLHHRDKIVIIDLMTFIRMVDVYPNFAGSASTSQLTAAAQTIIDAFSSDTNPRADRIEITSIHRDHDGKALLKLAGIKGQISVIETSTNMVNWVPIGVAKPNSDGTYEFDDTQSHRSQERFYRVVSPK